MSRRAGTRKSGRVLDYRHEDARRKNNPPAGMAPTYEVRECRVEDYSYDPHLDPQLQWSGKAEHGSFDVDVVSLHVHERVSTQAILNAAERPQSPQLSLFADPNLPLHQVVEFYQHDVHWANRLILGDSLLVMNSLLIKEGMSGKVQMVYFDPPYGVSYASNFQPRIGKRDVRDADEDLTHEPEQIRAYRDTWRLGIHSYLSYLRDRLLLCHDLLHESGSIFVQINDENLHLVRCLLDEVFHRENFVAMITFAKTTGFQGSALAGTADYLLWYSKDVSKLKRHPLFLPAEKPAEHGYRWVRLPDGFTRSLSAEQLRGDAPLPSGAEVYKPDNIKSQGASSSPQDFAFRGSVYRPGPNSHWKARYPDGMRRLADAGRIHRAENTIQYMRLVTDHGYRELNNVWDDTVTGQFTEEKVYAVQTNTKVIERCILMTTDPGDVVFDPTCGAGTAACCAEKWGRRWITCDTSRVAVAIARQRVVTARFDYYELSQPGRGPGGGFLYETARHIQLEDIARNSEIDGIAERHRPAIQAAVDELNRCLGTEWQVWEVPHEPESGWCAAGLDAHRRFWDACRVKHQEVDRAIQRSAAYEHLYDCPKKRQAVVRVAGPFTVEAIPLPVVADPGQGPIALLEEDESMGRTTDPGGDYLRSMIDLLRTSSGVVFPGGKRMELRNIRALSVGMLHAEAETEQAGKIARVAISFGPLYGPVSSFQVQEAIPTAKMNGYTTLLFAGFSFDPEAQALIQKAPFVGPNVLFANIAPDVLVGDLLKTNRASQVFTVFGEPDVRHRRGDDGSWTIELRGVDVYDPLTGETQHVSGANVAAWFLDTDYDGMVFHIAQAFFPGDAHAWEKLQRALKAEISEEAFEKMRGTTSWPFKPGAQNRIAVKVIDFRGNEVIRLLRLDGGTTGEPSGRQPYSQ